MKENQSQVKHGVGITHMLVAASRIHQAFYGWDVRAENKMKERERQRFCPRLNQLMYGKKYILPNFRQVDYWPQVLSNRCWASTLLLPLQQPLRDQYMDDVENCSFTNVLQSMKTGRPQLWLERELGEALMRTQLPQDMTTDDVKWRWPGIRIHLPKNLLCHGAPNKVRVAHDLMYLDICSIPGDTQLVIPEVYHRELFALAQEYKWPDPQLGYGIKTKTYPTTALMLSGNLNGPESPDAVVTEEDTRKGDLMTYAVVKPFNEAVKFGQISKIADTDANLASAYEVTPDDNRFCERILHLALQILLYLGSVPLEYEVTHKEEVLRKPSLDGRHMIPGLYKAKFVGASQLRPLKHPHSHIAGHAPTGRHLPAHWRAGHWKRQPFGPRGDEQQRKLIWIQPYQTTGEEYEVVHQEAKK